jgi:hypothetical protein
MHESVTVISSGGTTIGAEPLVNLRWVRRHRLYQEISTLHLQQAWRVTEYPAAGQLSRIEWRDVPTETEA